MAECVSSRQGGRKAREGEGGVGRSGVMAFTGQARHYATLGLVDTSGSWLFILFSWRKEVIGLVVERHMYQRS